MSKSLFWIIFVLFYSLNSFAQNTTVELSGKLTTTYKQPIPLASVQVFLGKSFMVGVLTNENGLFVLNALKPGDYRLHIEADNFKSIDKPLFVGALSPFLDMGTINLSPATETLQEVVVQGNRTGISPKLDKKTVLVDQLATQQGGSVLQLLQNVPGLMVQDGKVVVRGSDKITVLIDGRQTALTGFGHQTSLDNIPASAVEKIEVIQNPSAKFDANGQAGVINIIFKKNEQMGLTGKAQMATGLGALWRKQENLPNVGDQYQATVKANPSFAVNYRTSKLLFLAQVDYFHNPTLNKNEFVTRTYNDGTIIQQQTRRNRNTDVTTAKMGIDWQWNKNNSFSASALFSSERIIDYGEEPFFNADFTQRTRLWTFLEDELKTTVTLASSWIHRFSEPGHQYNLGFNYTFHREDEKYFFNNSYPTYTGLDSFKLLSDENVTDASFDYTLPLRFGKLEAGAKYRLRNIPTDMKFNPGLNSPLDTQAGGWAVYREHIPAVYATLIFERPKFELEGGLRTEYVSVNYEVDSNHNTYHSDGYHYFQPFPNVRMAWKPQAGQRWSLFYNRRVDRPNEFDLRVFPKYDDAEIIKIGNPALKPQYTQNIELGFKKNYAASSIYAAAFQRFVSGTLSRIATQVPGITILYNIMQNAGNSMVSGVEMQYNVDVTKTLNLSVNATGYRNQIDAFTTYLLYPQPTLYQSEKEVAFSGSVRLNAQWKPNTHLDLQASSAYLAPDIVPQGHTNSRFSTDVGAKYKLGKSQFFVNASDFFNTLVVQKNIQGNGFQYVSKDYYETQVIRVGYGYTF